MKKFILILGMLFLTACSVQQIKKGDSVALDYVKNPEIKVKTPEEWFKLVDDKNIKNNDIASYMGSQTCIPTKSLLCNDEEHCENQAPTTFLFITWATIPSEIDKNGRALKNTPPSIYRCNDTTCEISEFSDNGNGVLKANDTKITLADDSTYNEEFTFGVSKEINSGKCYSADGLKIARAKLEGMNHPSQPCKVDENSFSEDITGVNQKFTLKHNTELRASPIVMDCNVLDTISKGQLIEVHTGPGVNEGTLGAWNGSDKFIWLKINFNGKDGWIRGDFLDDQFNQE